MHFTSLKNCSDIESISIFFIAVKCILINGRLPAQQQKTRNTIYFFFKKNEFKTCVLARSCAVHPYRNVSPHQQFTKTFFITHMR